MGHNIKHRGRLKMRSWKEIITSELRTESRTHKNWGETGTMTHVKSGIISNRSTMKRETELLRKKLKET